MRYKILFCGWVLIVTTFATKAQKFNNTDSLTIVALLEKANKYYATGNYNVCLQIAQQALQKAKAINAPKQMGSAKMLAANCFFRLSNNDSAIVNAYDALKYFRLENYQRGIFSGNLLLANIYFNQNNLLSAKTSYLSALQLAKAINYTAGIGKAALNLSMVYNENKQTDSCLNYLKLAITFLKLTADTANLAMAYSNLGVVYFDKKQYNKSLMFYNKALVLQQNNPNITLSVGLQLNIASNYHKLGQQNKALALTLTSLDIAKQQGMVNEEIGGYEILSDIYFESKNHEKAFVALRKAFILKDSLRSAEQNMAINEVTNKFEIALKDEKIKNLQKQQQISNFLLAAKEKRNKLTAIAAIIVVFFAVSILLLYKSLFQQKQLKKLALIEKEKLSAELLGLQSQINPHVLFNSLNTIYFQLDENVATAKETILKYADILRYQLYLSSENYVPLANELNYLNKFIDIQRLRISERCKIDIQIPQQTYHFQIAPLLLINIVENAFKYVTNLKHFNNYLTIHIQMNKGILYMQTANSIIDAENNTKTGGIGLQNIVKRLNILYPGKHQLEVNKSANEFKVTLTIDLN